MHEVGGVEVVWDAKPTPGIANCPHCDYQISPGGSSFMRCLVVVQDEGWAVLCSLTNKMQNMNHIAGTRVYISLISAYTSITFSSCITHTGSNYTHCQHPEHSQHHVTCTIQCLSFQNTPENLQNFVRSLWAWFRYVQLYHDANSLDVDSFSTSSDGTKVQPQRQGEGNC
jgi:hypothetical protein